MNSRINMVNIKNIKKGIFKITSFVMLALMFSSAAKVGAAGAQSFTAAKSENGAQSPSADKVLLGGMPFGVKFYTEGITAVGFSDVDTDSDNKSPAYNAGIRENDIIISVNNQTVSSVEDFIRAAENSSGAPIKVEYRRLGKIYTVSFSPVLSKSEGKYKTGMWIKDSTAGIGTVTFIVPETKAFAGLGHSICDAATGEILKLTRGVVMDVDICGVEKSAAGAPGELKGSFSNEKIGELSKNTSEGIYGIFSKMPKARGENGSDYFGDTNNLIEIGGKGDAKEGAAHIICTVEDGASEEYEVNISQVNFDSETNKNYVIEVTDPRLIEKTGGIVQGMSGSPIIQNGKLIGAVTHQRSQKRIRHRN